MKSLRILFAIGCVLFTVRLAAAQSLVYMVSYGSNAATFRARFPNGIFGTTTDQRLAMLRRTVKNEIWSVSLADGKRTLLFSDDGMSNFEVLPGDVAISGGKALVRAVERSWRAQPSPGAMETPQGVYEISFDGSKRFRRVIDVKPNMGPLVLDLAGTEAGFQTYDPASNQYRFDVYALPEWKFERSVDLNKAMQPHCPDCVVEGSTLLADGKDVVFRIEPSDEDNAEASPNQVPGNYIFSVDGADEGSIPRTAGRAEMAGYERFQAFGAWVIGQLGDGRFVFMDYALKTNPRPKPPVEYEPFLVVTDRQFKVLKQLQVGRLRTSGYVLSANGKYMAYIEARMTPTYTIEQHVWVMDLESSAAKEIFAAPPPNPPTSPQPNITVSIVGWLDK